MRNDKPQFNNKISDSHFLVEESITGKQKVISFDWECTLDKIHWAKQTFLQIKNTLHHKRNQPILVKSAVMAHNVSRRMQKICMRWEKKHPSKPLWNWTREEFSNFLQELLMKECAEGEEQEFYAYQTFSDICYTFNVSHHGCVSGTISDGPSFEITTSIRKQIASKILLKYGITYGNWMKGNSHPPVPFGITSLILSRTIDILEDVRTTITCCIFRALRVTSEEAQPLALQPLNAKELFQNSHRGWIESYALKSEFEKEGITNLNVLPWSCATEFEDWRVKVYSSCVLTIFIQTGYRYAEVASSNSIEQPKIQGIRHFLQTMGKSLGGMRIPRVIPPLSEKAAAILWNFSYLDPHLNKIPFFHSEGLPFKGAERFNVKPGDESKKLPSYSHTTLIAAINKFYKNEIFSIFPDGKKMHPHLTFHQFRHSYAEFTIRRYDGDVHERLREHFLHLSEQTTAIYEEGKVKDEIRAIAEREYLHDLIGKTGNGELDGRFWGPAFKRLKSEIEKIKIVQPGEWDKKIGHIAQEIERLAAFEWGYCVLYKSSAIDAKCRDSLTGLPDIEGLSSADVCSGCPNNMGNEIQRANAIRISLAHVEYSIAHPIRAIGKLSADIAEKISKRVGDI